MEKIALIVEGGGMRGGFSAGVLDAFHDLSYDPFDIYGGVSGGAMNISSFLSQQRGRNYRIYRDMCTDSQFISVRKYLCGGHYIDLDWLWNEMIKREPYDIQKAYNHVQDKSIFFVVTNISKGFAEYLTPSKNTWMDILKASSSIPLLYRNFIKINNDYYTDGGVTNPIPIHHAISLGAEKIVLIRSRPIEYRIKNKLLYKLSSLLCMKYKNLRRLIHDHPDRYNEITKEIINNSFSIPIDILAPSDNTSSNTTSICKESLDHDYKTGYQTGLEYLT